MLPELCYQHLYVSAANLLIFRDIQEISAGKFHFSRYTDMLIGYSDNGITPTSTPTSNASILEELSDIDKRLVLIIEQEERSIKEMMDAFMR